MAHATTETRNLEGLEIYLSDLLSVIKNPETKEKVRERVTRRWIERMYEENNNEREVIVTHENADSFDATVNVRAN